MKKTISTLLTMAMLLMLALTGCGGGNSNAGDSDGNGAQASGGDDKAYTASLSTPIPETNIVASEIKNFVDLVAERTEGRVQITPFYNNVLGNQKDMFTALSNNEQELILDGSITDYYATEYGFLFAPFFIRNADHLQAILDGDLFAQVKDSLGESSIAVLGEAIRGSRVTYSTIEMASAEDISKLVIRMPDLSSYITAWSTLGASTQIMGGADVYSALSTGVVNSCEGPYSQGVSDKYAEVTGYLYPTNHVTEPYFIYASQKWLDSLPEDLAKIVADTAAEVMDNVTNTCAADADQSRQALLDAGMTYMDNVDFSGLFEKVRPIYEEKFASGEWASSYDEVMSYYKQ